MRRCCSSTRWFATPPNPRPTTNAHTHTRTQTQTHPSRPAPPPRADPPITWPATQENECGAPGAGSGRRAGLAWR